jgi:hypothetical protein
MMPLNTLLAGMMIRVGEQAVEVFFPEMAER